MKISVNLDGSIEAYATVGGFNENDIEVKSYPNGFIEEFQPLKYKYMDGVICLNENFVPQEYSVDDISDEEIRILELKSQLQQSDYKVRKCMEYSLLGLELPYDIQQIHTEAQAMRDEINRLESEEREVL